MPLQENPTLGLGVAYYDAGTDDKQLMLGFGSKEEYRKYIDMKNKETIAEMNLEKKEADACLKNGKKALWN